MTRNYRDIRAEIITNHSNMCQICATLTWLSSLYIEHTIVEIFANVYLKPCRLTSGILHIEKPNTGQLCDAFGGALWSFLSLLVIWYFISPKSLEIVNKNVCIRRLPKRLVELNQLYYSNVLWSYNPCIRYRHVLICQLPITARLLSSSQQIRKTARFIKMTRYQPATYSSPGNLLDREIVVSSNQYG